MEFPKNPPASLGMREVHFPQVKHADLGNGLTLHVVENHSVPLVGIKAVVLCGLTDEENRLPGVSHMVGEMLCKGTSGRTAEQIADEVDFLGTEIKANATKDYLSISSTVLSEFLGQALELMSDTMINPTFPEGELAKVMALEVSSLVNKRTQPSYQARKVYSKVLYGDHPYGSFDTDEEFLQQLDHDKLASFHSKHFLPRSIHVMLCGDVSFDSAASLIKEHFEGWQADGRVTGHDFEMRSATTRRVCIVDNPNAVQSNIFIGNLTIPFNHPDYIRLLVTNQVLGGSFASRLFMNLREQKSFTYGAYSKIRSMAKGGSLIAYASVRNEVTVPAIEEFLHEFTRIREEVVEADEMKSAKDFLTGSFPLRLETSLDIADHIMLQKVHSLPGNYWDEFRGRVDAVTPEVVMETARTYIHPEDAMICVVGKASELETLLAKYGEIELYDKKGKRLD